MHTKIIMLFLLLTVTLGVTEAGKLIFAAEQSLDGDGTVCPDQVSKCPNSATCCKMASGKSGCCPFEQALCCSDGVHCCPQGYSCDSGKGKCVRAINNDTIPWASKLRSVPVTSDEATDRDRNLLCPDKVSVCSGTSSCCRTNNGQYRCCAFPNDVCCSDGHSCCPRSSICDQLQNKCINGFATEEWQPLTDSISSVSVDKDGDDKQKMISATVAKRAEEVVNDANGDSTPRRPRPLDIVPCDDYFFCQDGYYCYMLPDGEWICIPDGL